MPPFSPESSKMKDYKRWGKTIAYVLLFVFIIMLFCLFHLHVFVVQKHIRAGRAVPMAIVERNSGLVTIQVPKNTTVAARIDLCDVVPCDFLCHLHRYSHLLWMLCHSLSAYSN
ncbi:hypothetical protein ILYODFUR_037408 [Ilyodon furcidens]|uniref:Uncharacterized protein n=1 Tax=Ilyodon furcidens TaxID=33524 RepID=A0ABV0SUK9_9TELE